MAVTFELRIPSPLRKYRFKLRKFLNVISHLKVHIYAWLSKYNALQEYTPGLRFVLICCGLVPVDLPTSFRITSLAPGYDFPSLS